MFYFLFLAAALVNLAGAFGPELGFDALWYHLTIPKLYLQWGRVDYIPGGLLYYSVMPKLGEFFYMLVGANDIGAHLINWLFGLGTALIIYKISRKFLDAKYSILAAIIFYATPLVGWQSGSAYVDIIRTFFEALAFYFVISGNVIFAGISAALAISVKTLALGSIPILALLVILRRGNVIKFLLPAILLSAPWFIYSYFQTGYPFYPLGAGILDQSHRLGIFTWWKIFPDSDPITPVYLILVPFFVKEVFLHRKRTSYETSLTVYVILSYLIWWLTPRTGGGRFLLPYLPVWSVLAACIIYKIKPRFLIFLTIFIAIINIGYRAAAQIKILPYLTGKESRTEYLCKNLDFKTAVFVDCDGFFAKTIKPQDLVLVSGFHNLYYINFPFVHESWSKNETVNYILTYRATASGTLVYENSLTGARLFKL